MYAVDSYKPIAGSIFVAIIVNKNVWAYGFRKFVTPWTISSGHLTPTMTHVPDFLVVCFWTITLVER